MFTREQFVQKAIDTSTTKYPEMAALIKAKDPRVMQQIEAMATMLEMYSSQLEVAQSEPFDKTRDSTVLADAAMRGLTPKSSPSVVSIQVTNNSSENWEIECGRELIDTSGRSLRVDSPLSLAAGQSGQITATQVYSKEVRHEVSGSRPFYAIPIEMADDDSHLCGIRLTDSNGEYEYRNRYTNTLAGELVYHIESDERRNVHLRLGQRGVVGSQPFDGDILNIVSHYSMGKVDHKVNSLVMLGEVKDAADANVEMRISEVLFEGENPLSMSTLKQLSKYPSVYNRDAVFLGEFDFLVRSNFPDLKFLSVWNEGMEESVRGAHLDSINAIFVSCFMGNETVLQDNGASSYSPVKITELTWVQEQILQKIKMADDSYRVHFYAPVKKPIRTEISATIPTSYDALMVKSQIEKVMIDNFGEGSVQRSGNLPLYQQVYELIKMSVPAMSVGRSDLIVNIGGEDNDDARPELWRYMTDSSLSVSVKSANMTTPSWGSGL